MVGPPVFSGITTGLRDGPGVCVHCTECIYCTSECVWVGAVDSCPVARGEVEPVSTGAVPDNHSLRHPHGGK